MHPLLFVELNLVGPLVGADRLAVQRIDDRVSSTFLFAVAWRSQALH